MRASINDVGTPRRRWVGSTPTRVTAPVRTRAPPGTVVSTKNWEACPTQRSPSHAEIDDDSSQLARDRSHDSSSAGGNISAVATVLDAARYSSGFVGRTSIAITTPSGTRPLGRSL